MRPHMFNADNIIYSDKFQLNEGYNLIKLTFLIRLGNHASCIYNYGSSLLK